MSFQLGPINSVTVTAVMGDLSVGDLVESGLNGRIVTRMESMTK